MIKHFKTSASILVLAGLVAACTTGTEESAENAVASNTAEAVPQTREGLAPGLWDAEEASSNMQLVHHVRTPDAFAQPNALWAPAVERALWQAMAAGEEVERPPSPISFANTDLAFTGNRVVMGNWHGFNVFETSGDAAPELILSVVCPGGQGDVSVHGDLVFRSVEDNRGRLDCGTGGVEGDVSDERFRGVQIFDISDLSNPRQVAAVQTCRGSHTHTLVPDPSDENVLYIYNSATSGVRSGEELGICSSGQPDENPETALYSIDVIRVDLTEPENAEIVNRPRIFADRETGEINGLWMGGAIEEGGQESAVTNHCHDINVYPELGIAAGACSGNGILLDISDPVNPSRISEMADPNFAYWHAAIFNNAGDKIVFTDEWGGGLGARCRPEDPENWGANVIANITEDGLERQSYYKIPGNQTAVENCVAHNGNLVPVPGRDIMVQGWYSGGLSVIDFTDSANPVEIAWFDRGPLSADELYLGGHWAGYWHNGYIYGAEIVRGLDVLQLTPSDLLTENEIAAANLIRFDEANTQVQERFVWPNEAVVAHAYLDQLVRGEAVDAGMAATLRAAIEAGAGDADLMAAIASAAEAAGDADRARFNGIAGYLGR
ncbi:hypothetical protein [Maricaulis sp.]|uniref:LVIVD repeat-containing protein n=1 Tax=Maricaulis sp. TaxID=1486257 RepID=UPI00260FFAE2|nr:hypothetical protein [Maricaulis sp.]